MNSKEALQGLGYAFKQGARVSQFVGQVLVGNRILGRRNPALQEASLPSTQVVLADLYELFERDLRNIRAGLYLAPQDSLLGHPLQHLRQTALVFWDLLQVRRRLHGEQVQEVPEDAVSLSKPHYYRQNFHFQTDGYFSDFSAEIYDHQVEMVFVGGADAMRRQALLPLRDFIEGKSVGELSLLDVACGTGRFLSAVKQNYPLLHVTGLDLSPWYLKKARNLLSRQTRADFIEAPAESMPFKDAHFDVLSCIYLFHELPRQVRHQVVAEMLRVLKPGGLLIFEESLQLGDKPALDGSLRYFPRQYHEPYYKDYIEQDLEDLFVPSQWEGVHRDLAFFSKIMAYRKR